ncbi:Calcium/calmodulin-dependent 3',5'-cyclic nucleotide phosphodiesterase 1C [Merluccius polli]|uniref:Calcium/calmodulin-dependent 3',5'-cyclic nucleotide phosphodiesterase 1C n=1 Tax=Merluccius polli TaxID=89951 RepID=A0AA47MHM9_MERPO|nr:Calcium/calmodulin-dependent 3',5'-cyclic nucleotide phosphodiesterase 1C [Merluccius polli]
MDGCILNCGLVRAKVKARAPGSKSQNALWNAITAGIGIKDKDRRGILIDPRSPEEILADELPSVDGPDAMEKTAISCRERAGAGRG